MKTNFLSIVVLTLIYALNVQFSSAQIASSGIDKRAELVGVVYRLAGYSEYSSGIKSYGEDIKRYFADYVEHPVIKLAQEYRQEYGLSHDAAMWVGIHILIDSSSVTLDERMDNNMPGRWSKERLELFVKELSDFYNKSNFEKFLESQADFYAIAEKAVNDVVENKIYYPWFNNFWGTNAIGDYNVIVCPASGTGNYGLKVIHNDGKEDVYAVFGVWQTDDNNNPMFPTDNLVPLFVHEINHSYDKGLGDNIERLRKPGEIIFPLIEERMRRNAYGSWDIVLEEAMVRAGVINYMENDPLNFFNIDSQIASEKGSGFFWIEKLANEFREYAANRDIYPSIKEFMPKVIRLYDDLAAEMSASDFAFPEVKEISIENDSKIDASVKEIIITFNKPMRTRGYGINPGSYGRESCPKIEKIEWEGDRIYSRIL